MLVNDRYCLQKIKMKALSKSEKGTTNMNKTKIVETAFAVGYGLAAYPR